MLYQLIYSSRAAQPMTAAELEEILVDARDGNVKHDITGALVYVDGVFIQILEGDRDDVNRLLANIADDPRHRSLKVFYEAAVEQRAFASWRMAYVAATREQMLAWAGLPAATTIDELLADISRDSSRGAEILRNILQTVAG
jgi:hypothetical protein